MEGSHNRGSNCAGLVNNKVSILVINQRNAQILVLW